MSDQVKPGFRELFEAHYGYVRASLRRLGVHVRDLDDLTDDVFLRVHDRLHRHDPSTPVRPWLFAFAFRIASDYRRLARHRLTFGVPEDQLASDRPSPEDAMSKEEDVRLVHQALETMSLETRGVFVMYEIDGHEMKEIATALGVPVNTAYSRLRLGRRAFAAKVRELRGIEADLGPDPDLEAEVEAGR